MVTTGPVWFGADDRIDARSRVSSTEYGLTLPRRWQAGDRIAAVSLSWGGPGVLPDRYRAGVRQFEAEFGVEVVEMASTLARPDVLAARPQLRVDDLHAAFADPDIHGVVSTIGGDDSIRLLPLIDLELLADNPKAFLGYSDSTMTHMALRRAGIVSYYGPAIMAGFGENAGLHDYLVRGVRSMLFEPSPTCPWPPNTDGWTTEMLDWSDPALQDRPRTLEPSTGWRWHGGVTRTGPTVVACLEVLDWLRGSAWMPDLDGAVLLLETSEEAPPPEAVLRFLRVLHLTGDLARLSGIVLGRPGGEDLDETQHLEYDQALVRAVRDEAGIEDLPLVSGVDFGHTDPMWTVPQGLALRVDTETQVIEFVEPTAA